MKKLLLSLLCLAMCFSMAACSMPGGAGTAVCQHRDVNDDSLCDKCSETYVDGKDIQDDPICQHRDINDDSKCDRCDSSYTDGKDVIAPCQHRDMDDNNKCDTCGVSYSDGQDVFAVCQHRDADDDAKCDTCGETYTDGKDLECAHDFSDWTIYGDNADAPCDQKPLYRVCSVCGGIEWKDGGYENHSFETTYTANASFHWLECKNCDAKDAYAEHTADESGFCTTCNTPLAPTEDVIYDVSADGTYAEVIGYTGTATKILIAETYEGLPVKVIYDEAFQNNDTIRRVVIPDSVTSIGYRAFYSCSKLASVTIGDSVTSIGDQAFFNCSSLASVTIPDSVTSIGDVAFYDCSSLASVTIENDAVVIGNQAFDNCHSSLYTEYELGRYVKANENPYAILIGVTNKNLSTYKMHEDTKIIAYGAFGDCARMTSIAIPDGVRSIGSSAFYDCDSLASVTIPDSVTSIGYSAFRNCSSLTSVTIGNSVTSIGGSAFDSCSALTSVTIGNSVTSIGENAFYDCSALTSVTIGNSVTSIGDGAFYSCSALASVYYKGDAAEWNAISIDNEYGGNGSLIYATRYYYSEEAPTEEGNYWHCDADGKVAVW